MSIVKKVVTDPKSKLSKNAKENLLKFVIKINKELENYFKNELKNVSGVGKEEKELNRLILNHIKEHNLRPAKRLRASLAYYSYKMLGGKNEKSALHAGMGIELVHTAILMHDDFMDQDAKRRGKQTTHKFFESYHKAKSFRFDPKHYGDAMAVNTGDVTLCLGYEIVASINEKPERTNKALSNLLRGIANTAYGQALDITLEASGRANENELASLHRAKTAVYTYENPLHVGGLLAGADKKDLQLLSEYAIPAGIAFQMQDDILGLFGDPGKTGKPAHSDLQQGKMTLLITKALEKANINQREIIKKYWGDRKITNKEAEKVREIVKETGSLEYSRKVSKKYAEKAQSVIPKMQKRGWEKEGIDYLNGIAQYMIEREV